MTAPLLCDVDLALLPTASRPFLDTSLGERDLPSDLDLYEIWSFCSLSYSWNVSMALSHILANYLPILSASYSSSYKRELFILLSMAADMLASSLLPSKAS
jgi:hypothetical protein|tara:strand:+ start:2007 stop:2309 length:303 start_codon:yes stop_codon:yes gene_type:complete